MFLSVSMYATLSNNVLVNENDENEWFYNRYRETLSAARVHRSVVFDAVYRRDCLNFNMLSCRQVNYYCIAYPIASCGTCVNIGCLPGKFEQRY